MYTNGTTPTTLPPEIATLQHENERLRRQVTSLEEALNDTRRLLQTVVNTLPQMIFWKDGNSVYQGCDTLFATAAGVADPAAIVGLRDADLPWKREETEFCLSVDQRVMQTDTPEYDVIEPQLQADGQQVWFRTNKVPLHNAAGQVIGILGTAEDITGRRRQQEELQHLLAASPVVLFRCKASGDFGATFISENVTRMFGYAPHEFTDDSQFWAGHIHPDDAPRVFADLAQVFAHGHHSHEYRFQMKDGGYRWIYDQLRLICDEQGHPIEMVGSWQDITGRKQAEEELRQSRALFEQFFNNMPASCYVLDEQGRYLMINDVCAQALGVPREQIVGSMLSDQLPANVVQDWNAHARQVMARQEPVTLEQHMRLPDGEHTFLSTVFLIRSAPEQGIMLGGISVDITERKHQEEAFRAFKTLADNAPDGIAINSLEGTITYANKHYQTMHAYGEDIIGTATQDLMSNPVELESALQHLQNSGAWQGTITHRRRDGSTFPVMASVFTIADDAGHPVGLVAIDRDITEQQRAEAERAALQQQVIDVQQNTLRELSTPLIPISDEVVLLPLIGTIDTQRAQQIMETLLTGVAEHQATLAILDITGVAVVDTQVAQALIQAAQAVKLLGAQVILTGIQPQIAQTLVYLNVDLQGIVTHGSLQSGITAALQRYQSGVRANGGAVPTTLRRKGELQKQ
ncbi:MAG: PAS domain S-box protein [Chloroflexaceae bacterium]